MTFSLLINFVWLTELLWLQILYTCCCYYCIYLKKWNCNLNNLIACRESFQTVFRWKMVVWMHYGLACSHVLQRSLSCYSGQFGDEIQRCYSNFKICLASRIIKNYRCWILLVLQYEDIIIIKCFWKWKLYLCNKILLKSETAKLKSAKDAFFATLLKLSV